MYPTEELSARNRWQDEYDTATRDHMWESEMSYALPEDDDEMLDPNFDGAEW